MRIISVALLIQACTACTSDQRDPGASAEDRPVAATASSVAERAAEQACSVYSQGFVWDCREIDTNDGSDDFIEAFPAEGSEVRVRQIADTSAVVRQGPRFKTLSTASESLVSIYESGGDRSEVLDAEGGMTEASDALPHRCDPGICGKCRVECAHPCRSCLPEKE
jgi:hypothetical protein